VQLSLIPYTRSPTLVTVFVAARHATPTSCTPRDKQTRFSKRNKVKVKVKQNKTILDLNSNLTKLMTHHNQIKELTTWFLRAEFGYENGGENFEARDISMYRDDVKDKSDIT
jgi:hypothetical protein